jgi:hypothetical protein
MLQPSDWVPPPKEVTFPGGKETLTVAARVACTQAVMSRSVLRTGKQPRATSVESDLGGGTVFTEVARVDCSLRQYLLPVTVRAEKAPVS